MLSKIRAALHKTGVALGMRRDVDRYTAQSDDLAARFENQAGTQHAETEGYRLFGQLGGTSSGGAGGA